MPLQMRALLQTHVGWLGLGGAGPENAKLGLERGNAKRARARGREGDNQHASGGALASAGARGALTRPEGGAGPGNAKRENANVKTHFRVLRFHVLRFRVLRLAFSRFAFLRFAFRVFTFFVFAFCVFCVLRFTFCVFTFCVLRFAFSRFTCTKTQNADTQNAQTQKRKT